MTAVRANPSVLSSVSDICDRSEHLVELEIDYVQLIACTTSPPSLVEAGFDETCMLRIDFSSSEAKAEEGLEVEAASPPGQHCSTGARMMMANSTRLQQTPAESSLRRLHVSLFRIFSLLRQAKEEYGRVFPSSSSSS